MSIVLLLSGGLDSVVLGEIALEESLDVHALTVSYGQAAETQETLHAMRWCRKNGVDHAHQVISLAGLGDMNKPQGVKGPRIVPARNAVLISTAVNLAKTVGASEVWYGATAADHEYPDCSRIFVQTMDALFKRTEGVGVKAPLIGKTRAEIVDRGKEAGLLESDVWSCYNPLGDINKVPCGLCNSCRQEAL